MMKLRYILLRSLISFSISYLARVFEIDLFATIQIIFFLTLKVIQNLVFIWGSILFFYGFFTNYNKPRSENLFIIDYNSGYYSSVYEKLKDLIQKKQLPDPESK